MEDRRLCPHCGGELHRSPYLMARNPQAEMPWWGPGAIFFLIGLIAIGVAAIAAAH